MMPETATFELLIGAVIIRHNTVLLIKHNTPPKKGLWCIPVGPLKLDQTMQQSMEQHIATICGMDVVGGRPLYNHEQILKDQNGEVTQHRLTLYIEGKYQTGEPVSAGINAEEVAWVSVEAMEFMDIDEEALLLLEALGFLELEEE